MNDLEIVEVCKCRAELCANLVTLAFRQLALIAKTALWDVFETEDGCRLKGTAQETDNMILTHVKFFFPNQQRRSR